MDKNTAIEFVNVGKQYRLGLVGTGSLQHDLNRWWQTTILRKEDPYLKIGEVNDRSKKGNSDYVWALKDISFKVKQGDVVGIIGKNGAGKSTLLKLLSHITAPSTGTIDYRGRIASLLEVGTGFHPEMTGRENIYMNGSIMGMSRSEIDRKLDEIVDFAGVERYLDTPTKRYSSGMTVRLGFAVAAFLEPEILVVDEVLTVGDAEFQKKAIGKMGEVSSMGGRTVLFVSHNMSAVRTLCNNGIVLKNGCMDFIGTANECVDYYLETNINELKSHSSCKEMGRDNSNLLELEYTDIKILNDIYNISTQEELVFELSFKRNLSTVKDVQIGIICIDESDNYTWVCYSSNINLPDDAKSFKIRIAIKNHNTAKGRYRLNFNLSRYDYSAVIKDYDVVRGAISFEVNYVDEKHKKPFTSWQFKTGCSLETSQIVFLKEE